MDGTPMIDTATKLTRIGAVILPVTELDRALDFYVARLGFEKRLDVAYGDGGRWVEVGPPGAETTLALVPSDRAGVGGTEVSLASSDATVDHADLLARGVDVDVELTVMDGSVPPMFTFRDPDGNPFRVVERA
jgi:catechol 2,3-dioxygenase-like lactoylglutathione lyase family enzyme